MPQILHTLGRDGPKGTPCACSNHISVPDREAYAVPALAYGAMGLTTFYGDRVGG